MLKPCADAAAPTCFQNRQRSQAPGTRPARPRRNLSGCESRALDADRGQQRPRQATCELLRLTRRLLVATQTANATACCCPREPQRQKRQRKNCQIVQRLHSRRRQSPSQPQRTQSQRQQLQPPASALGRTAERAATMPAARTRATASPAVTGSARAGTSRAETAAAIERTASAATETAAAAKPAAQRRRRRRARN